MSTHTPNPEKTSKKEQAINLEATHGKNLNQQVKAKKEYQQPRDTLKTNS